MFNSARFNEIRKNLKLTDTESNYYFQTIVNDSLALHLYT